MATFLTFCFCFKLCCDASQETSRGGMSNAEDEEDDVPLVIGVQPGTQEMSRFKF